jgi:AP2 domain
VARIDIPAGSVFSRLTVIEEAPRRKGRYALLCECACGKRIVAVGSYLLAGHTRSCGCLRYGELPDLSHLNPGEIYLHGSKAAGRVALVEDSDYDFVMQHRWYLREIMRPGRRTWGPYAATSIGREKTVFMHCLLMGAKGIDHVNGNGLDNRRSNLRPATNGQNMWNRRPNLNHSSQYKGVQWAPNCGNGKWRANIKVNGTSFTLGFFTDEREAAEAYDAAAREAFGEFARPNFPKVA